MQDNLRNPLRVGSPPVWLAISLWWWKSQSESHSLWLQQRTRGKIHLPSQYMSLQGADLACSFTRSRPWCNQRCRHCLKQINKKQKEKTQTKQRQIIITESKLSRKRVGKCWPPQLFFKDYLESWNWLIGLHAASNFHAQNTTNINQKSRAWERRTWLNNEVDEFFKAHLF